MTIHKSDINIVGTSIGTQQYTANKAAFSKPRVTIPLCHFAEAVTRI